MTYFYSHSRGVLVIHELAGNPINHLLHIDETGNLPLYGFDVDTIYKDLHTLFAFMKDIRQLIGNQRLVIDGALGTLLEDRIDKNSSIHPQNSKLWSGKVLLEQPQLIEQVHEEYIASGADMVISSTYQLSYPSLVKYEGLNNQEISTLWIKSIDVANRAIQKSGKPVYLVGSVGPYATFLADGSEYSGDYGQVSGEQIFNYYLPILQFLSTNSKVDIIGIETIPNFKEFKIVLNLLKKLCHKPFYISCNFVNSEKLPDGTCIYKVINYLTMKLQKTHQLNKNFLGIGLNCIDYLTIHDIIKQIPSSFNILVYPNLGYTYDLQTKKYQFIPNPHQFEVELKKWLTHNNVRAIGGCCLTTPKTIELISKVLQEYEEKTN